MKKLIIAIAGLSLCATFAMNANATAFTQSAAGEDVTMTVTGSPAFDPFTPSTNVVISGASVAEAFAVGAYHNQVLNKKSGKAFGMASDANSVYYLDIATGKTAAGMVITGTNSSAFSGTYTEM